MPALNTSRAMGRVFTSGAYRRWMAAPAIFALQAGVTGSFQPSLLPLIMKRIVRAEIRMLP